MGSGSMFSLRMLKMSVASLALESLRFLKPRKCGAGANVFPHFNVL